jgi:hypothetical protein
VVAKVLLGLVSPLVYLLMPSGFSHLSDSAPKRKGKKKKEKK